MMRAMSGEEADPPPAAQPAPAWRQALDRHCERFLGACPTLAHELVSDVAHLDLHPHQPADHRPWITLRTGGVSEIATRPPHEMVAYRHVELLTYLPPTWDLSHRDGWWPGRMLKQIGRHVHLEETWLGPGHTLTLGDGDLPIAPGTPFTGAMLLPPSSEPAAFDLLEIAGIPVRFLWVVPLTTPEIDYKLAHGSQGLLDLMREGRLPRVVDPDRRCLVSGRRGEG
jgi:hypothetical protein